jgi:hypothetical protein
LAKGRRTRILAGWANSGVSVRDPFDDGRSFWAQTFTPGESGYLAATAVICVLIIAAFALL